APGDEPTGPVRAHLLDLGLAWLFENRIDPRLSGEVPRAPSLPVGSGTVGWLAPEQIRRATPHIGPAAELYALGGAPYELLAGREVFVGSPDEVLRAHRDAPVPRLEAAPEVPAGAAAFVAKLLAKRPWHRYRLAADARAAWQAFRPVAPATWTF